MMIVLQTSEFSECRLRDARATARMSERIERAAAGHIGDVEPVGGGVSEMRIHHGPGYRVYFVQRGGDKGTQKRGIRRAKAMAKEIDP